MAEKESSGKSGSREVVARTRIETAEQAKTGVEQAKKLHSKEARSLGVAHTESKLASSTSGVATATVRKFYPDTTDPIKLSSEYIRMVAQYRRDGDITESNYRDTSEVNPILEAKQPAIVEEHLQKMGAVGAKTAPSEAIKPKPYRGRNKAVAARVIRRCSSQGSEQIVLRKVIDIYSQLVEIHGPA